MFQCLPAGGVSQIILGALGGPFVATPLGRLKHVPRDEACAHPTWTIGRKISVDSSIMINTTLEVTETYCLFGLSPEQIELLIYPRCIAHSLVQYDDGSAIAQISHPDMRVPIATALAH